MDILKKASETADDAEIRDAAGRVLKAIKSKNSGLMRMFPGHKNRVNGVAISADGKRAVSACWDGIIRYWNLENGDLIRTMGSEGNPINSTAMSDDGKLALSGGGDQIMRLWDLETGNELRRFSGHTDGVWNVAFSPDGTKALSGCGDGVARLWDLKSGKALFALPAQKVGRAWSVAFTPDGQLGVTGGGNVLERTGKIEASLRLWDLKTGKEIREFNGHIGDIRAVAVSPDGKQLLSGSWDGTTRLWDIGTGKELKKFDVVGRFVEGVAFTKDGKRIVSCHGARCADWVEGAMPADKADTQCTIRVWNLASGKELKRYEGHTNLILCLAISEDGRFFITGSADNTMRQWQMPR
jgi:WD40 repeat protein